jgi:hypothetical protein
MDRKKKMPRGSAEALEVMGQLQPQRRGYRSLPAQRDNRVTRGRPGYLSNSSGLAMLGGDAPGFVADVVSQPAGAFGAQLVLPAASLDAPADRGALPSGEENIWGRNFRPD